MSPTKWIMIGCAGLIGVIYISTYNGLVTRDEDVKQSYAQVQNVMQRQADLIPNLVETVKGYASFEGKTLIAVAEARARLSAVSRLDPSKIAADQELQKKMVEAQLATQQAMISLNSVKEAYPQLQANDNFRSLMAELAGSQNRITIERRRNQLAVEDYNRAVRQFPRTVVASLNGFPTRPYFAAEAEAQHAPKVTF